MNTPHRPRPQRVALASAAIALGAVAMGALLAAITTAITGSASPLPATAPWDWSLSEIARWFSSDAAAAAATDVAVRVLASVAWLALIVIVVSLGREVAHQAQHGVIRRTARPAPATDTAAAATSRRHETRRHGVTATLVAILLGGSTLTAGAAVALPTHAPTAALVHDHAPPQPVLAEPDGPSDNTLPPGWTWTTHTIDSPHESLASIARSLSDDPNLARTIWDANRDRDMGNGEHFNDPAIVKHGWTLRIPTAGAPTPTAPIIETVPSPAAPLDPQTPATHIVITATGDNLWDQIDDVVDTPTAADIDAVAQHNDGATTPLGPWTFSADIPDLIHTGMAFDLQPAIDLHNPPTTADHHATATAPDPQPTDPADTPATAAPAHTDEPTSTPPIDDAETNPALPSADTPTATQAPNPTLTATATTSVAAATPPTAVPTTDGRPVLTSPPAAAAAIPRPVTTVPPPAPAQPGDVAPPATAISVENSDGGDTSHLPLVPLAAAGMTLGGLVLAIDWHRRRRQAHDPNGRPVSLPDDELLQQERVLRASARLDRAARANAALRHLATELAARATVLRARYILVDDDDVIVVLDQPAAAPAGWDTDPHDPRRWRCLLDDTALNYAADVNPHPWPAVVPLGTTVNDDADVLIDLEALGSTALTGPAGSDVVAALICALGASPHTDMLTIVDDGHIALYGLEPYLDNRLTVNSLDAVLERLEAWTQPFRFEAQHLLAQRHDDPGALEPCVAAIVARIDEPAQARLQSLRLDGTRPIAILTIDRNAARTVIHVDEQGLATFDDQTVRCHRLTPAVAAVTQQLLEHADTTPTIDNTHDVEPRFEQPSLFPPNPDAWTVRLLGPLRIQHQQHGDLQPERRRQLLTLLALHPDGLSGEDIYDAIVPDKIADPDTKRRYTKARISELRKALGGGDTITGRLYLPITSNAGTDRYRIDNTDLDAARFRYLASQPDDVLANLTAAMELIDGEVGRGELSWFPWAPSAIHEVHATIVDAGRRLATTAMTHGQPGLADWAAAQTRLAVPFDQSVVPFAIRARSLLGDRVGVRRLRDELVDTHNGDLANDVKAAFDEALAAG